MTQTTRRHKLVIKEKWKENGKKEEDKRKQNIKTRQEKGNEKNTTKSIRER